MIQMVAYRTVILLYLIGVICTAPIGQNDCKCTTEDNITSCSVNSLSDWKCMNNTSGKTEL